MSMGLIQRVSIYTRDEDDGTTCPVEIIATSRGDESKQSANDIQPAAFLLAHFASSPPHYINNRNLPRRFGSPARANQCLLQ